MFMDKIKIKYVDKDTCYELFERGSYYAFNLRDIPSVLKQTTIAIQYSVRYKELITEICINSKFNSYGKIILNQYTHQNIECDFYYYESICIVCVYRFSGNQIAFNKLQEKLNCPVRNFKNSKQIEEFMNEVKKVKLIT